MSLFFRDRIKPVLALFFSLSPLFAGNALFSVYGDISYIIAGGIVALVQIPVFFCIIQRKLKHFSICFLASGLLIILSIILLSIFSNNTFLKCAFHSAGQLFIISLYRKDDIYKNDPSKSVTRMLIASAYFLIISAIIWMLTMGYNIIFKNIDGGAGWMLFNLYSVINILISIDALISLQNSLYTIVFISHTTTKINSSDYSSLLSPQEHEILKLMAVNDERRINCAGIVKKVQAKTESERNFDKCRKCLEKRQKATLCADYKRIYNQINRIKRFLESMNIGTILPPENKMNITSEGWTLHIFENVRINIR